MKLDGVAKLMCSEEIHKRIHDTEINYVLKGNRASLDDLIDIVAKKAFEIDCSPENVSEHIRSLKKVDHFFRKYALRTQP